MEPGRNDPCPYVPLPSSPRAAACDGAWSVAWSGQGGGDLPAGLEEILEEIRRGDLPSLEELEARVAQHLRSNGLTPRAELEGNSPEQARVLLEGGLEGSGSVSFDVRPLHVLQVNLELAGLLRMQKGRLLPSRRGRKPSPRRSCPSCSGS